MWRSSTACWDVAGRDTRPAPAATPSEPGRPLTSISVAATGTGDVDRAWQRYTTPSLWPTWSPQIRAVDTADPDAPVRAGTTGTVHGPAGARVAFVVTDVDPDARTWTWRVQAGLVRVELGHSVEQTTDGVRATARVTAPLPVALGYAPLARLALTRLVDDTAASSSPTAGRDEGRRP